MDSASTPKVSGFVVAGSTSEHSSSSLPPSAAPTILCLPVLTSLDSVRGACRDAWRVFVEQSSGWGKAELVLWTYGLYAPAARWSPHAEGDAVALERLFSALDPRFVERMVEAARARVLDALASFEVPSAAEQTIAAAQEAGLVTRCVLADGETCWIPTPSPRSFGDRLVALVVADALNRPEDFAGGALCGFCGTIIAGAAECTEHGAGRTSCVVTRIPAASPYDWAS